MVLSFVIVHLVVSEELKQKERIALHDIEIRKSHQVQPQQELQLISISLLIFIHLQNLYKLVIFDIASTRISFFSKKLFAALKTSFHARGS